MKKSVLLLVAVLLAVFGHPLNAPAQQTVSPATIGPIWDMQRGRESLSHAELGIALSPDGKAVTYTDSPEEVRQLGALVLVDLETGKKTVLRPSDEFGIPSRPSFSADGKRIAFNLGGITTSYSQDLYSITTDGSNLRKLTQSVEYTDKSALGDPTDPNDHRLWTDAAYQQYYYNPRYSPDGSRILLEVNDAVQEHRNFVAVMKSDGSDLQILAEGRPDGWSADGKSIYYGATDGLTRMDLATRKTVTVPRPVLQDVDLHFLGIMKGKPWFAFIGDDGRIRWYDFDNTTPLGMKYIGDWSVPAVKMNGAEEMTLKGFDWSNGSEVLLWYQGEETERFEVVRIADPASITP